MEECTAKEDVAGAIVVEEGAEDGALIGLMLVLGGVDIRLIAETYGKEHDKCLQRCDPCHGARGHIAKLVALVVRLEDADAWTTLA